MSPFADCNPRPETGPARAERLAVQLASMLPGAVVIHVRLQGPQTLWPHLGLTAMTERGHTLRVTRAKSLPVARWIIRCFPHARWAAAGHSFDLRTAELHGLEA